MHLVSFSCQLSNYDYDIIMYSEKLADLERDIEANLPIDPAESRKYIKDLLDRYQSISQNKPDPATSHIAKHKDAIQYVQ